MSLNDTFGRRRGAWRACLELLAVLLRDETDVQERQDLPSFMAAPFIIPRARRLTRRLQLALRAGRLARLLAAERVGRAGASWRAAWLAGRRPTPRPGPASRSESCRPLHPLRVALSAPWTHPHLLPGRRHRPLSHVLRGARLRGAARMPIRDEAINVFMGLPGDGVRLS